MKASIKFNGKEVVALNSAGVARFTLTSDTTAARWRQSGRLKPAQVTSVTDDQRTVYFYLEDLQRLRAEALTDLQTKVAGGNLTADERAAILVAGLQDIAVGLENVRAMFAKLAAK